MKLRTKTFLLVSSIAGVAIFLVAGVSLHHQEQTARNQVFAGADALARATSTNIAAFLQHRLLDASVAAAGLPVHLIGNKARKDELDKYLKRIALTMPYLDSGIFLLDKDGLFLADYPAHPELRGRSFTYRDYFKLAAQSRTAVLGEPYRSTRSGLMVQTFAAPILDANGSLLAVLGCSIDLLGNDGLGKIVFQKLGEHGYIYTFDRASRMMITHPDNSRMLQRDVLPGMNLLLDKAVEGFEGTGETINSRGIPMLAGVRSVAGTPWLVAAQMPQEEAFAPIYQARHTIALIATSALLLSILLSLWATSRITRSINRLHQAALGICEDLQHQDQPLAPNTHARLLESIGNRDEIGTLARTFEELSLSLDSKMASLRLATREIQVTFDAVAIPLFRLDTKLRVVQCNRTALGWLRLSATEPIGCLFAELLYRGGELPAQWPDLTRNATPEAAHELHWIASLPGCERSHEFSVTQIIDDQQHPAGSVVAVRDITERLHQEKTMQALAFYDPLTKLPNRRLLADRLQQALSAAQRQGHRLGLMLLDLDHFKRINDTHGHDIGDALLREVAARLLSCLRTSDTLARVGGDEFVIVLAVLSTPEDACEIAERIIAAMAPPFKLGDVHIATSTSIGIAIYPDCCDQADTLTKIADVAMYEAKKLGRNRYVLATAETSAANSQQASSMA